MDCRPGCGACCIAPSIASPLPGLPSGKPPGVRCPHLSDEALCALFHDPSRPEVCRRFRPAADVCGESAEEAFALLMRLETLTRPGSTDASD